ncbi:MAG: hypothetical protein ACRC10_10755 [Thermoguttaceae bacterium]
MSEPNWGMINDGGVFESLVHAILFAKEPNTLLFGRPGKDAAQDARSADGTVVYQAKYRQGMTMDDAIKLALDELKKIKTYRQKKHANYRHWKDAKKWVLVANFETNTNDHAKWENQVVPAFGKIGLEANYWDLKTLDGELTQHPEIHDVFFDGENHVLVGLHEAHNLLEHEFIGSDSLDKKLVGREAELEKIKEFVTSDKRILPVIGVGGIGKSRLLYESLLQLSEEGWQVFWALPESMKQSSKWFHLLNGNQKTCVVIDGADFSLMKVMLEQLSTNVRKNRKVIISCRTEKADFIRQLQTNQLVANPLNLKPLNEEHTKELLTNYLENTDDAWAHSVYQLTKGVPGWICLVAELAKQNKLPKLPETVTMIASLYVNSCLESISEIERTAKTILRWLALWGTLKLDSAWKDTAAEIAFLKDFKQIIPDITNEILEDLVRTGLVKNYGIGKRCYSIQPKIIRQHILSDWLFSNTNGTYQVNCDGQELVRQLVAGEIYPIDTVLRSLAQLAIIYLDDFTADSFFAPLFNELENVAKSANARGQKRIAELVERIGKAAPERALDVLKMLRENIGEDEKSKSVFWGEQVYTHNDLLDELPWILFCIAEYVSDESTARRVIGEFQEYVKLEDNNTLKAMKKGYGKSPRQLLRRLLCESRNSTTFAEPARKYVSEVIADPSSWPCVGLVCECLLDPLRQSWKWVGSGTLQFSQCVCPAWDCASQVRSKIYELLTHSEIASELRPKLWQVLANAHGVLLRATFNFIKDVKKREPFIEIIKNDLEFCVKILTDKTRDMTLKEAEQARDLWENHLRSGNAFVKLAEKCEEAYAQLAVTKWKLHEFFSFDDYKDPSAVKRTAKELKSVSDYQEFFTAAKEYLDIARKGKKDMADYLKIAALADECIEPFDPVAENPTPLVQYVQSIVAKDDPQSDNEWAWLFVVDLYQRYIATIKRKTNNNNPTENVNELLNGIKCKNKLLFAIYSNAGPDLLGLLTEDEFEIVLKHKDELESWNFVWLLGVFAVVDAEKVKSLLQEHLGSEKITDLDEKSRLLGGFIRSCDMAVRRYKSKVDVQIVEQIISIITDSKLDGRLLGLHELKYLCEQSGYKMPMTQFCKLIESRIKLDLKDKPYADFVAWPDDFELIKFVTFDATKQEEPEAFNELCSLAVSNVRSFIASYSLPEYIRQFDDTGQYVTEFVKTKMRTAPPPSARETRHLAKLAAIYPENSASWTACASLICEYAQTFSTAERFDIYYALENTSGEAIESAMGEVADHYYRKRDDAKARFEEETNSHLKRYRKWALERAKARLRAEQERVEEVNHE